MADTNKETLVQKLTDIADGFRTSRSLTEKLSLDDMATLAAVPIGSGENKFTQLVEGSITELTVKDLEGVTDIRSYAFNRCSKLINITIPNNINRIYDYTFTYCTKLTNAIMSDSNVEIIGNYAFAWCDKLNNVLLPNVIKKIDTWAFYSCSNLTNITIPNSITTINTYGMAIGSTTNKATITFLGTTPPTITSNALDATKLNKIIVPKGCGEAYKTATNWANFADFIEEATV